MKETRAFTLIELLVMVALSSTLMWVLLSHYDGVVAAWRDRQAVQEARQLLKLARLTTQPVNWQWHSVLLDVQDDADPDAAAPAMDEPAPPPATDFAQLSVAAITDLTSLRDRLAAIPGRGGESALLRSVVDQTDPVQHYVLGGSDHAPSMTVLRPIHIKPHATTRTGGTGSPLHVHFRVEAAHYAVYAMPARIEREAFALGEEPDGWADTDD